MEEEDFEKKDTKKGGQAPRSQSPFFRVVCSRMDERHVRRFERLRSNRALRLGKERKHCVGEDSDAVALKPVFPLLVQNLFP